MSVALWLSAVGAEIDVSLWHKADIETALPNVRFWEQSGHHDFRAFRAANLHLAAMSAAALERTTERTNGIPNLPKVLAEHGCRFDTQPERRGEGHGTLVIHRAGRTAELPLVGESHNLDPRSVRQVCEALGLDWSKLPGPEGRV
jgi:hypothetical protein